MKKSVSRSQQINRGILIFLFFLIFPFAISSIDLPYSIWVPILLLECLLMFVLFIWNIFYFDKQAILEKKHNKLEKREAILEQKEKELNTIHLEYYGGGDLDSIQMVDIHFDEDNFIYDDCLVPLKSITGASIKTETQAVGYVKSRTTFTRMALFGVFALAVPKHKEVNKTYEQKYLLVDYNDNGFEGTLIFGGKNLEAMLSEIKSRRNEALQND